MRLVGDNEATEPTVEETIRWFRHRDGASHAYMLGVAGPLCGCEADGLARAINTDSAAILPCLTCCERAKPGWTVLVMPRWQYERCMEWLEQQERARLATP